LIIDPVTEQFGDKITDFTFKAGSPLPRQP